MNLFQLFIILIYLSFYSLEQNECLLTQNKPVNVNIKFLNIK